MAVQTIFQAGNSQVVSLPTQFLKELNLKKGDKVLVEQSAENNALIIKKAPKKLTKNTSVYPARAEKEFQNWLDTFIKDNGKLLDELAIR